MKDVNGARLAEYTEYLTLMRQQLDDEVFNRAWTYGCSMPIDQAVEIAMNYHY